MGRLKLREIPKLVGDDAKERATECFEWIDATKIPLYMIGPSGSSKTHTGLVIAKAYAKKHKVPAYYIQLSPDQTKTSVIGGLRLVGGSLKSVNGTYGEAMEKGGIIFVDEVRHATQSLMLMFNSSMDRFSVTSIGDKSVIAEPTFRAIFASNSGMYAGNSLLPQSFAQRPNVKFFDYPTLRTECQIATTIAKTELGRDLDVPDVVVSYIAGFVREIRNDNFPLSARNIATAIMQLDMYPKKRSDGYDDHFSSGANVESTRRALAKRILGTDVTSAAQLNKPAVRNFILYVSSIGVEKFRDAVLGACMYHLEVDGTELNRDTVRTQMASTVI